MTVKERLRPAVLRRSFRHQYTKGERIVNRLRKTQ